MPPSVRFAILSWAAACSFGVAGCSGGGGAGPTAPAITNLQLQPRTAYESATPVTFLVGFDLFDPNRDVQSASFVLRTAGGQLVDQQTIPFTAPVASLSIAGSAAVPLPQIGTFDVEIWTTDAAGLTSNSLTTTVQVVPHAWSDLPADLVVRQDAAAAALDGQVYLVGGSRQDLSVFPGPSTTLVTRLDPATETWTTTTPMTVSRRAHTCAVAGGNLYAIGGEIAPTGIGFETDSVERFDPLTEVWTPVSAAPTARVHAAAATVGGRIYVVGGGLGAQQALDTLESYDPVSDTWTTEAPMPHARHRPRAAAFGGKLVVIGGSNTMYSHVARVDVFDPATGTWSNELRFFDTPCTYLTNIAGQLYAGGGSNPTWLARAGDPELATWQELTGGRHANYATAAAAATDDGIFVFGSSSAERYRVAREIR
ncbi:MAG: hypothetical protein KDC48_05630 [Planctomycetes bacterium]|nr:hypothetical protein [Planctomycetota bacterium]